jgi:hypothetical protein
MQSQKGAMRATRFSCGISTTRAPRLHLGEHVTEHNGMIARNDRASEGLLAQKNACAIVKFGVLCVHAHYLMGIRIHAALFSARRAPNPRRPFRGFIEAANKAAIFMAFATGPHPPTIRSFNLHVLGRVVGGRETLCAESNFVRLRTKISEKLFRADGLFITNFDLTLYVFFLCCR